jgi:hypothetical protein
MTRALLFATGSLLLAGCAPDQWVELEPITELPSQTVLQSDRIQILEGRAVGVEAIAIENNKRLDDVALDLVVDVDGIIGVDRGLAANTFVIFGIAPGSTSVDIYFDDELVGDMPAVVVAADE